VGRRGKGGRDMDSSGEHVDRGSMWSERGGALRGLQERGGGDRRYITVGKKSEDHDCS